MFPFMGRQTHELHPMLLCVPRGSGWHFKIKLDGCQLLAGSAARRGSPVTPRTLQLAWPELGDTFATPTVRLLMAASIHSGSLRSPPDSRSVMLPSSYFARSHFRTRPKGAQYRICGCAPGSAFAREARIRETGSARLSRRSLRYPHPCR